jgi:hypothetical protein
MIGSGRLRSMRQKCRGINDGDDRASKNHEEDSSVSLGHARQRIRKTISLIPA